MATRRVIHPSSSIDSIQFCQKEEMLQVVSLYSSGFLMWSKLVSLRKLSREVKASVSYRSSAQPASGCSEKKI